MLNWRQYRQVLIALTSVSVFFTLGRFGLDSTAGNRPVTAFAFPSVVPLPGWQLLESRPLAEPIASRPPKSGESVLAASQKYHYQQNNQHLQVEMRYVLGTWGDIHEYLKDYTPIQLQSAQMLQNLRQHEKVGFYSLFVYQGRAHLSACINPRGRSTVTSTQFLANRHTYYFQLGRLVPWLLGKESLRDNSCLWAHLSTPLNQVSAQNTYPVLEQAWLSWYQWWFPRFPKY